MITESMTIQRLHAISLALSKNEAWEAAGSSFDTNSSVGIALLTVFAVIALTISVILLFWVFSRHRNSEHRLNLNITELTIANVNLQQENDELTTTNEKLQQENAELHRKQVEVLENIINTETPSK